MKAEPVVPAEPLDPTEPVAPARPATPPGRRPFGIFVSDRTGESAGHADRLVGPLAEAIAVYIRAGPTAPWPGRPCPGEQDRSVRVARVVHDPRTGMIATRIARPVPDERSTTMDKKAKTPKKPKSATPKSPKAS